MGGYTIGELAEALAAKAVGDLSFIVSGISEPATAGDTDLAVAMDTRYLSDLQRGQARAAILNDTCDWQELGLVAAILVDRPRLAMARLTSQFRSVDGVGTGIHETAVIDPTARIGTNVSVGAFAVISENASIGDNAVIGPHVSIAAGSMIGGDALIQAGVRIGTDVSIGDRFVAHSGVVIGADGFSFVTPEVSAMEKTRQTMEDAAEVAPDQSWLKIHSLGGVEIGDDVEIGSNSSVDAGTIRATKIGGGTKIDALVQVGHNVRIGKNCLLCAHVAVGGSAVIGDSVVLAGQVGVADNITIGDGVVAGGASKILSNVPKGRAILGYPAVKMKTHVESYKALRRLPRVLRDIAKLQQTVSKPGEND